MKIKLANIKNYYAEINKFFIYDNNQLKGITHYNQLLIRINIFYLHDYLLTNSLKHSDMNVFTKYYYKLNINYLLKNYTNEHSCLFIDASDKKYSLVVKELNRTRRTINHMLNIYKSNKNIDIIENLIIHEIYNENEIDQVHLDYLKDYILKYLNYTTADNTFLNNIKDDKLELIKKDLLL